MATTEPLIFINLFTVEPANQQRLIELLTLVTSKFVRHAPGFVSSRLHRSLDGKTVAMYARWRSSDDYEAMRRDPRPRQYLEEAMSFATFAPGSYHVVADFTPDPG
jgi:quinol monooxygenase YgiN